MTFWHPSTSPDGSNFIIFTNHANIAVQGEYSHYDGEYEKMRLMRRQAISTVEANNSNIKLNNNQRAANWVIGIFTGIILLATVCQVVIAYLGYIKPDIESSKLKEKIMQMQESARSKHTSDSLFQQVVRDSLKMKKIE